MVDQNRSESPLAWPRPPAALLGGLKDAGLVTVHM